LEILTFVITTPGEGEASAGGFPLLSMAGQFLINDIVLLGVSILTLADAMRAIAHRAAPDESIRRFTEMT
jgi:reactive chlorine resistance protein C